jgi:hypothetical protein
MAIFIHQLLLVATHLLFALAADSPTPEQTVA